LLNIKELKKTVGFFYEGGSSGLERVAMAQRDSDIKWYGGEK